MTTLITEYTTMTPIISAGPPSSSPMIAGGMTPMTNPMLGMKLVTKASTAQMKAAGTPMRYSATPSITATMKPKPAATPCRRGCRARS